MDLRGLEAVVAVHEHRSFSSAALALFISQPALTRRIALLERELGARLFERTPRGALLTAAGEALLGPARRALRETQSIGDAIAAVRNGLRGALTIVGMTSLSGGFLGRVIAEFHAALPEIEIRMVKAESSAAAAASVEAGEFDLAVVDMPVQTTLAALPVVEEEFYAVFAEGRFRDGVDAAIPIVTKAMLDGHTMVHLPTAQFPKQRASQLWTMVGAEPTGHLEISDCELLLPITRTGRAVAVLPRSIAMIGRAEGLTLAAPPRPIRRTVAFARHRGNQAPAVAQFLRLSGLMRRLSHDAPAIANGEALETASEGTR